MSAPLSLSAWLEAQLPRSVAALLGSVSRTDLVKPRPVFAQQVRAARGSVLASPVLASYDPDPDYFFHWFRDSAVVLDALRLLWREGRLGDEALAHLADFVAFNRGLGALDGRALLATSAARAAATQAGYRQYLRDDADLAAVHGDAIAAETRVNPDGTLDITRWARPQHDGPPLRALALLGWATEAGVSKRLEPATAAALADQIEDDVGFALRHWQQPSYDIWEEERGLHYYTLRVSAAALEQAAPWLRVRGQPEFAIVCELACAQILQQLDGYWSGAAGHYRSRVLADGTASSKELDIAVILAAVHSPPRVDGAPDEPHGAGDPRQHATLDRLEAFFAAEYAINRARPPGQGVAMGRYPGDVYYSGGAYFFSTFGAAEFCYRAAQAVAARRPGEARRWLARGDGFLACARAYTGADGALAEQFDREDGHPTSARQLAWSHAALISTRAARRAAVDAAGA